MGVYSDTLKLVPVVSHAGKHCLKNIILTLNGERLTSLALTLLHSKRPKLHTILAFLSAVALALKVPKKKICRRDLGEAAHNKVFEFAI